MSEYAKARGSYEPLQVNKQYALLSDVLDRLLQYVSDENEKLNIKDQVGGEELAKKAITLLVGLSGNHDRLFGTEGDALLKEFAWQLYPTSEKYAFSFTSLKDNIFLLNGAVFNYNLKDETEKKVKVNDDGSGTYNTKAFNAKPTLVGGKEWLCTDNYDGQVKRWDAILGCLIMGLWKVYICFKLRENFGGMTLAITYAVENTSGERIAVESLFAKRKKERTLEEMRILMTILAHLSQGPDEDEIINKDYLDGKNDIFIKKGSSPGLNKLPIYLLFGKDSNLYKLLFSNDIEVRKSIDLNSASNNCVKGPIYFGKHDTYLQEDIQKAITSYVGRFSHKDAPRIKNIVYPITFKDLKSKEYRVYALKRWKRDAIAKKLKLQQMDKNGNGKKKKKNKKMKMARVIGDGSSSSDSEKEDIKNNNNNNNNEEKGNNNNKVVEDGGDNNSIDNNSTIIIRVDVDSDSDIEEKEDNGEQKENDKKEEKEEENNKEDEEVEEGCNDEEQEDLCVINMLRIMDFGDERVVDDSSNKELI